MEPGHVREERIGVGLNNVKESDAREIAFNCLVLEVLLPKVGHKFTEGILISGIGLEVVVGAELHVAAVAGGV